MNAEELREALAKRSAAYDDGLSIDRGETRLLIGRDSLVDTALDLRDMGFERLDVVTAVDRGDDFEMVYRLESVDLGGGISLRCMVPRDDARVASLFAVWPAADWQEREVFDMFGITFEGHPDPRRILLPEDWVGYPLRKDYADERVLKRPDYI